MSIEQILASVNAVQLRDPVFNMYENNRLERLSTEAAEKLLHALETVQEKSTPFDGCMMYALDLLDQNDQVLCSLIVDDNGNIDSSDGRHFVRQGEVSDVLSELEDAYQIKQNLYDRKPGKDYFTLLTDVSWGRLEEITENNFIDGIDLRLGKENILPIKEHLAQASFADERTEHIVKKYILFLYSEGDGMYYELYFDDNGRVYTAENYEILNSSLTDWLAEYIKE